MSNNSSKQVDEFLHSKKCNFKKGCVYSRKYIIDCVRRINADIKDVYLMNRMYNRSNNKSYDINLIAFEYIDESEYKFLGFDYEYSGDVVYHPKNGIPEVIGTWKKGKYTPIANKKLRN
jgi:hypothetical protein